MPERNRDKNARIAAKLGKIEALTARNNEIIEPTVVET